MRSIVTDQVAWSVTLVSPAKMAKPTEMPFGLRTHVGPGNHVLHWGPDPHGKRQFLGGGGTAHCKVQGHSAVTCAKTAEPDRDAVWIMGSDWP